MHVSLVEPLKTAAKIRVTYNGAELFTEEFAAGDTPNLDFETPQESGHGQAFLLVGDKEHPIGMTSYYFQDLKGAAMLLEDAAKLEKGGKHWRARSKLLIAIEWLEKLAPDSQQLAEAYLDMTWVYWLARCRKANRLQRKKEAIAWYEKALSVWERNANFSWLSGNLTNVSVMYTRIGDPDTALARAQRGLELEIAHPTPADSPEFDERVASWSHAADCLINVGKLDDAEAVIKDGLERMGDVPNCGYLWALQARIHDERAKQCRQKAEEILPPQHCAI